MNLKEINLRRVSDSSENLDGVMSKIEELVKDLDPVEGGSISISEEEIGVPITEELRDKVEEYLIDKFMPEEGTEEYDEWEWEGAGAQVSVDLIDGVLEIEVWDNVI